MIDGFDFTRLVEGNVFKFSKSMPNIPHWYSLKDTWSNGLDFIKCVSFIRDSGYKKKFANRIYTYFNSNGYKYWTMGAPVYETTLINRALVKYNTPYDVISETYSTLFNDVNSIKEDTALFDTINIRGRVLDIGCGSGLLLKYNDIEPSKYIGIDPSVGMIKNFNNSFADFNVINCTFEDYYGTGFDTIVALYGTASYINPNYFDKIPLMLNKGGTAYLMFYSYEYTPVTYIKTGISVPHFNNKITGYRFGNYIIKEISA